MKAHQFTIVESDIIPVSCLMRFCGQSAHHKYINKMSCFKLKWLPLKNEPSLTDLEALQFGQRHDWFSLHCARQPRAGQIAEFMISFRSARNCKHPNVVAISGMMSISRRFCAKTTGRVKTTGTIRLGPRRPIGWPPTPAISIRENAIWTQKAGPVLMINDTKKVWRQISSSRIRLKNQQG